MNATAERVNSIRAARVRSGKTQEDAAAEIGVTRKTISNWEQGEALSMSLGSAIKMADCYGCKTIDDLVGRCS